MSQIFACFLNAESIPKELDKITERNMYLCIRCKTRKIKNYIEKRLYIWGLLHKTIKRFCHIFNNRLCDGHLYLLKILSFESFSLNSHPKLYLFFRHN